MASFSVPCPKTSAALSAASQPKMTQTHQDNHHRSISFRDDFKTKPALLSGPSSIHKPNYFLPRQVSSRKQSDVFQVCAQHNEAAMEKSTNSSSVSKTQSEDSSKSQTNVPDASSISAFMSQVADLVELVDSRDIMELHLKNIDCELLIRKKEALPQPPVADPIFMMQNPSPQAMAPYQLPPVQVAAPPSASPVSSPSVSAPAPVAKPKSSHPPFKCPMAGTFYRSPGPGAPPFVKVGDKVQKGQVVCIIEAMKLMNEIEADHSGTIVEILADDGKPVSVDLPLFVIEP